MYHIYLNKILYPVAPEKITIKVKGGNKTISLINESEVNQIKKNKLSEISFELPLPNQQYPFAVYQDGFQDAYYYLTKIKGLKDRTKPFKLKIIRTNPKGDDLWDTSLDVTLEEYTINEDANDGFDVKVSVTLKEYVEYGVTRIKVKTTGKGKQSKKEDKKKTGKKKAKPAFYTVKGGDTLWAIAKRYLGSGSKWKSIYNANKSVIEKTAKNHGFASSATGHWIFPDTKLTIPKG